MSLDFHERKLLENDARHLLGKKADKELIDKVVRLMAHHRLLGLMTGLHAALFEKELEDPMPDVLWELTKGHIYTKEKFTDLLRVVISGTKKNIAKNIQKDIDVFSSERIVL